MKKSNQSGIKNQQRAITQSVQSIKFKFNEITCQEKKKCFTSIISQYSDQFRKAKSLNQKDLQIKSLILIVQNQFDIKKNQSQYTSSESIVVEDEQNKQMSLPMYARIIYDFEATKNEQIMTIMKKHHKNLMKQLSQNKIHPTLILKCIKEQIQNQLLTRQQIYLENQDFEQSEMSFKKSSIKSVHSSLMQDSRMKDLANQSKYYKLEAVDTKDQGFKKYKKQSSSEFKCKINEQDTTEKNPKSAEINAISSGIGRNIHQQQQYQQSENDYRQEFCEKQQEQKNIKQRFSIETSEQSQIINYASKIDQNLAYLIKEIKKLKTKHFLIIIKEYWFQQSMNQSKHSKIHLPDKRLSQFQFFIQEFSNLIDKLYQTYTNQSRKSKQKQN